MIDLFVGYMLLVIFVAAALVYSARMTPTIEILRQERGFSDLLNCTVCVHGDVPKGIKIAGAWMGRRRGRRGR